jgi:hypothetical protein
MGEMATQIAAAQHEAAGRMAQVGMGLQMGCVGASLQSARSLPVLALLLWAVVCLCASSYRWRCSTH